MATLMMRPLLLLLQHLLSQWRNLLENTEALSFLAQKPHQSICSYGRGLNVWLFLRISYQVIQQFYFTRVIYFFLPELGKAFTQEKFSVLWAWISAMQEVEAVKKTALSPEAHITFFNSRASDDPQYGGTVIYSS